MRSPFHTRLHTFAWRHLVNSRGIGPKAAARMVERSSIARLALISRLVNGPRIVARHNYCERGADGRVRVCDTRTMSSLVPLAL